MTPIFSEYRSMLAHFGIDLSNYDENKLWIDRLIIRGFDKNGNQHKICKLKVNDNLEYEYSFYNKAPNNEDLITYEELFDFHKDEILERERESIEVIKMAMNKYPNYRAILTTSMGKDSKLVEFLVDKYYNNPVEKIFNNTTLDCSDVYNEVASRKDIKILTPKFEPFYKAVKKYGTPSRFSRWCCSWYKEGSTEKEFENCHNLLFFYGMRNEESITRSSYEDEFKNIQWTDNSWIGILPIRKWSELQLWLYELHNNISINPKYKKGYSRVGCAVACPYYTYSTWVLDKYWYPFLYERWHKILHEDFVNNEKWCRLNCTEAEYHLNWNGGQVRENPTDEVIQEFMDYKGFNNEDLARQYFTKTCKSCGKKVYKKDEVAMNLKYHGRNTTTFFCKKCFMKDMNWTKEDWEGKANEFKQNGCSLF